MSRTFLFCIVLYRIEYIIGARGRTVDTNAAGNGNLEVTVTNPAGATLYNYVRPLVPGVFGVFFSPTHCGMHLVNVSFNGELICGAFLHIF